MSDPVAEAAAQLAALSVANMAETDATTPFMEKFAAQLAASQTQATPPVEVPNVPAVAGASATAPATAEGAGGAAVGESASAATATVSTQAEPISSPSISADVKPAPESSQNAENGASELPNAAASTQPAGAATAVAGDLGNVVSGAASVPVASDTAAVGGTNTSSAQGDLGNVAGVAGGGALATGAVVADGGDLPNAASVAVEPTTALGSASNAAGESITSTTGVSSGEIPPLHARVGGHLEMIYRMVKDEAAPAGPDTSALKIRVGDVLFRISNGMAVSEGDMVQKLEALYRAL